MKKIFALFLLLACALQASWATDYNFSARVQSGQMLYFHILSPNTVEIVYPGISEYNAYYNAEEPTGDLVIPSTITNPSTGNTYQITTIGDDAFFRCSNLTSVTIPSSVTTINGAALAQTGITSITIPSSVTSMDAVFFSSHSLQSVTIDNAPIAIANQTFYDCTNLTSVDLGNAITSIAYQAFNNCSSLSTLTVPNTVTSIANNAFSNNIIVHYCGTLDGAPWGARYAGCTYEEDGFVYADDTKENLLLYTGASSAVTIPNSVTNISDYAFSDCESLTSVTIPDSVTKIGKYTFSGCSSLTSIAIPNSVTNIGNNAFNDCESLTSIVIPSSVTTVGNYAFQNCWQLAYAIFCSSPTIGRYPFQSCDNLAAIYDLSEAGNISIRNMRVIRPTIIGEGDNALYQIPDTYSVVASDYYDEDQIPSRSIPSNFLYKDGTVWKAKKIVLTDGEDAFVAPVEFIAAEATYTREFTNSNRSTLYLPFSASVPTDLEVYDFSNFEDNTLYFTEPTNAIAAYTPYLVGYDISTKDGNTTTCTISATNVTFPKSEASNYHPVTSNGMTFQGVIERTTMSSTSNYGYSNGYFVQSGGWAHVNPFRCYFTYSNAPAGAPPLLNVDIVDGELAIDEAEMPAQQSRTYYSNDVYDMMGRLIRRNAQSLEGIPTGVYIWKGQKVLAY